ncbi:MAG: hypothetical protein AAF074_01255 [Pseudomonadota bacterium]
MAATFNGDIIAWNMRGSPRWDGLFQHNVGSYSLQETGDLPGSIHTEMRPDLEGANFYVRQGWLQSKVPGAAPFLVTHLRWGKTLRTPDVENMQANSRCSLAIATQHASFGERIRARVFVLSHHDILRAMDKSISTPHGIRPVLCVQLDRHAMWPWLCSIHAPSGNSGFAAAYTRGVISLLHERLHSGWVLAGDFNCAPADIQPVAGTIFSSGASTQASGSELDYAITNDVALTGANRLERAGSDHHKIRFGLAYAAAPD